MELMKKSKITLFLAFFLVVSLNFVVGDVNILNEVDFGSPMLYFDTSGGDEVPSYHNLTQGESYTFYIKSDNPSGLNLSYYIVRNEDPGEKLCSGIDSSSGEINCIVDHEVLTGSTDPAETETINVSVRLEAIDDDAHDDVGNTRSHYFTLIPINQQAYFTSEPTDPIEISAASEWTLDLKGKDMDMHHPLNFTVISDINDVGDSSIDLAVQNLSNTTAQLYFTGEGYPGNKLAGEWNITVNLTDSEGFSESRPASQLNFTLIINTSNSNPEFEEVTVQPNGTQYENFTFEFRATDTDVNDNLTFSIEEPSDSSLDDGCSNFDFPWSIETINQSATNATGVINETLNISHVACRYANIVVNDGQGGQNVSENFFFNITNVNDPPYLHRFSIDGDIKNQTAYRYSEFSYRTNASDPDNDTYADIEHANLSYYVNDSRFSINSSGSISIFPLSDNEIGNFNINVTVSDGFFNHSRIMNLTIENNTPPFAYFDNNLLFSQYDNITLNASAYDIDNDSISVSWEGLTSFNDSLYDFELISSNFNGISNFTWLLNLTNDDLFESNEQVGFHSINLTFEDEKGAVFENSSKVLNFTIENVNDAPYFSNDGNTPLQVSIGTAVVDVDVSKNVYAYDPDFIHDPSIYDENLSFEVISHHPSLNDVEFVKTDFNRASLSFTPSQQMVEAFIELMVIDSEGLNETQNVTFNVLGVTNPPAFDEIKPYRNTSSNSYIPEFKDASSISKPVNFIRPFNVYGYFNNTCQQAYLRTDPEVITNEFDAIVDFDNLTFENEPNNITYEWYVNGSLEKTIVDADPGVDSSFEKQADFYDTKTLNITLRVIDASLSENSWSWIVDYEVNPHSRVDYCEGGLEKHLEVNGTSNWFDYFSFDKERQRFYSADDDLNKDGIRHENSPQYESTSLEYSVSNPETCTLVDFEFNDDDLKLKPKGIIGQCIGVKFKAENPMGNSVVSEPINISVVSEETSDEQDVSTPETGTTSDPVRTPLPIVEEIDNPKPIRILFPGNVSIFANRTISVPVALENTWDDVLRGISLSASVPTHPETNISFRTSSYATVPENDVVTTELLLTDYRGSGPFEIIVSVDVNEPEFDDSASILISSLEQLGIGDDVQIRVTFARDMLAENPECQELNFYLQQAEEMIQSGEMQESVQLVSNIINSCRYLITEQEDARMESPSMVRRSLSFSDQNSEQILFWTGILTLLGLFSLTILLIRERIVKN